MNSIIVRKNAARNDLVVTTGTEQTTVQLAGLPMHKQINLAQSLVEWKNNGYKGTAPI